MELLNSYIAVNNIDSLSGNETVQRGTVKQIADGITDVSIGDKVMFLKADGQTIKPGDKELIVIKSNKIIGKVE